MGDVIIRVDNLSKQYQLGAKQKRYSTLRDSVVDVLRVPIRWFKGEKPQKELFWALKDVSFEVKQGESVGIIGRNGAGKSTLLKILSRITKPSSGRAELFGRVGSLLEVGTGFHPELTGRENIYLNGSILGMTRVEIDRKFDEIVDFAEVENFLDTPVKFYSSGMYVRLAFAVAAHLEPEILIVDEVLAVGDAAFQKKSLGKMGDVARSGRTVLFVSHNMGAITRLCNRGLLLSEGKLLKDGTADQVVSDYLLTDAHLSGRRTWDDGIANLDVTEMKVFEIRLCDADNNTISDVDPRYPFFLEIRYKVFTYLNYVRVGFRLTTMDGIAVFEAYDIDDPENSGSKKPGEYLLRCEIPGGFLGAGGYLITIGAGIPKIKNLVFLDGALMFNVEDKAMIPVHLQGKRVGILSPTLKWVQRKI
jgi:lipopolysaccharide transport system ATP-binding protein